MMDELKLKNDKSVKEMFKEIDKTIHEERKKDGGCNLFNSINDLDLSHYQKIQVLEWFARKLWWLLEEGSGEPDYSCKSYDPLYIDGNTAHSYVFNLESGGRHHPFRDLEHLEEMLVKEGIKRIQEDLHEAEVLGPARKSV